MHYVMLLSSRDLDPEDEGLNQYLPLFTNSSLLFGSPLMTVFSSLLSLELFVLFISVVVSTALIFALKSSSLFHPNLKIICIAHLVEFYFLAVAQVVLICYQSGILKVTDNPAENLWLIGSGVCKMHFMCSTIFVQTAIVFERTVATNFILNYEVMKGKWIGSSICVFKWLLAAIVSVTILSARMTFTPASVLVVALLLLTATWYTVLLLHNKRLAAGCTVVIYSLSAKYQVTENIRILKLVRNVFILITTAVGSVVLFMAVARSLPTFNRIQPFIVVVLELIISGFPIEMSLIMWWDSIERNRLALQLEQRARQRMYSTMEYSIWDSAQESLLYFKQLNRSWSKQHENH